VGCSLKSGPAANASPPFSAPIPARTRVAAMRQIATRLCAYTGHSGC
jgi:hypothetical protein